MKRRGDKVSRRAVRALANADSFAACERARLTITAADTRSQRSPKTVKFDTVFAAHFGPAPIHAKNARTSSVACAEAASTPNVAREHSPNQGTKPATAAYGRVRNRVYHIGVTCRNATAGTAGKASALRPLAQLAHRPRSRCRARDCLRDYPRRAGAGRGNSGYSVVRSDSSSRRRSAWKASWSIPVASLMTDHSIPARKKFSIVPS